MSWESNIFYAPLPTNQPPPTMNPASFLPYPNYRFDRGAPPDAGDEYARVRQTDLMQPMNEPGKRNSGKNDSGYETSRSMPANNTTLPEDSANPRRRHGGTVSYPSYMVPIQIMRYPGHPGTSSSAYPTPQPHYMVPQQWPAAVGNHQYIRHPVPMFPHPVSADIPPAPQQERDHMPPPTRPIRHDPRNQSFEIFETAYPPTAGPRRPPSSKDQQDEWETFSNTSERSMHRIPGS